MGLPLSWVFSPLSRAVFLCPGKGRHSLCFNPTRASQEACPCRKGRRCGFHPWVGKIPWRRKQQPTPVFLPGESHGQRSLSGYSPRGCKESDTTEATQHARRLAPPATALSPSITPGPTWTSTRNSWCPSAWCALAWHLTTLRLRWVSLGSERGLRDFGQDGGRGGRLPDLMG